MQQNIDNNINDLYLEIPNESHGAEYCFIMDKWEVSFIFCIASVDYLIGMVIGVCIENIVLRIDK